MARSMAERGYGREHWRARAAVQRTVDQGAARCTRCGGAIRPGSAWDLDHTEDRSGYLGPAHAACNRSAGAVKGNRVRGRGRFVSEAW